MSENFRVQRVEKQLQEVVAGFLIKGFKIPLPAMVTVSRVEASRDLKSARVYVSVYGEDAVKQETSDLLNEYAKDFQREIGKSVRMKSCPKLVFKLDGSIEFMERMSKVLSGQSDPS